MFKTVWVGMVLAALAVRAGAATEAELTDLVKADLVRPVRPGGVDGQAFWNMNAMSFMYPPSFDFPKVEGAEFYRFRVIGSDGRMREFSAPEPTATLAPVWADLPSGRTELWCEAGYWGKHCLKRSYRSFWKSAPYRPGGYPKAPRSYADAIRLGYTYLLDLPSSKRFVATGRPDMTYQHNCYPTKMHAATVLAMADCARRYPDLKTRALELARVAADYLLSVAQPTDAPLAFFTPTYDRSGEKAAAAAAREYAGQCMTSYPAMAGSAFLVMRELTGDAKYLAGARGIAETYLRLQGGDGTWFLKLHEKDGKPVNPNRLLPISVMDFMDKMFAATGEEKYRACADRAFAFFEHGPLTDWDWEGQFEDVRPNPFKYVNQTKHPACSIAIRICRRWPHDAKRLAQARELLRFAEDQFVYWERPFKNERIDIIEYGGWDEWIVEPAVVEQYHYRMPVDASAAKLIRTYLALHKASGNPLDLAKARTLGDALVRVQTEKGRIPTLWSAHGSASTNDDWINCMIASILALGELEAQASGVSGDGM